jgi:hypothetical protein
MSTHVMPSQCEQCVPLVTYSDYITHYAHETDCPNRKDPTQ